MGDEEGAGNRPDLEVVEEVACMSKGAEGGGGAETFDCPNRHFLWEGK